MAEYIDREALLKAFGEEPQVYSDTDVEIQERFDWITHTNIIKNVPAADVAEVVRCRDCKYNPKLKTHTKNMVWCRKWRNEVNLDDFCSYGERRITNV